MKRKQKKDQFIYIPGLTSEHVSRELYDYVVETRDRYVRKCEEYREELFKLRNELAIIKLNTRPDYDYLYKRIDLTDVDPEYWYFEVTTTASDNLVKFRTPDRGCVWHILPLQEFNAIFEKTEIPRTSV